jgi:hypothetical protein
MNANLHPRGPDYLRRVCELLPQPLAGYIAGVAAASCAVWQEGGLLIEEVSADLPNSWTQGQPSELKLLQEFFSCVYGNRSQERVFEAQPVVEGFLEAMHQSYPQCDLHIEVETLEGSWAYRLHAFGKKNGQAVFYICLFWSVD